MNQKPPASIPIPTSRIPVPNIRTPDQRLRVFVSSTLDELRPERRAAREAIAALRLTPVFFEAGARPYPPRELYRAYLSQSDIFIGVYWQRYGWVAPEILDHRGIVLNFPIGALAHLGLARAYVLQGDTVKARTAYQDFLTLWKDADPDIPVLKEAKAEYAKLQ
jgi:hypothetical protein